MYAVSHLAADRLHEALQLGEGVGGLQSQLPLRQVLVGLICQLGHSGLHTVVGLHQLRPAQHSLVHFSFCLSIVEAVLKFRHDCLLAFLSSPELLCGDLARLPFPLAQLQQRQVQLELGRRVEDHEPNVVRVDLLEDGEVLPAQRLLPPQLLLVHVLHQYNQSNHTQESKQIQKTCIR